MTTSSSRFLTSFVIDDLPRLLDLISEIRVANRTLRQQIDSSTKHLLEGYREIEIPVRVRAGPSIREEITSLDDQRRPYLFMAVPRRNPASQTLALTGVAD